MYEIHWPGMYATQWLERISRPERIQAIAYIIGIHKELDQDLIKYIDDSEGNSLMASLMACIQAELTDRQIAEFLSDREIGDFGLGEQKLLFASLEPAEAMSLKIKKIYQHLDLFTEVLGRDYLNLEAIDPRKSRKQIDYTSEMEGVLAEYWSLFQKNHTSSLNNCIDSRRQRKESEAYYYSFDVYLV